MSHPFPRTDLSPRRACDRRQRCERPTTAERSRRSPVIPGQGDVAAERALKRAAPPADRLSMRRRGWWLFGSIVWLAWLAPAATAPAQTGVRLAIIVNPGTNAAALTTAELTSIFTRATRTWKDGATIRALNLPPGSPERVEFDRVVLSMTHERSAQFWIDRQIRGEEGAPKAIAQAEIVVRLVANLAGSVGYVPEDKVDAKVRVVARIRGGQMVAP
jgi:hypothetical protein